MRLSLTRDEVEAALKHYLTNALGIPVEDYKDVSIRFDAQGGYIELSNYTPCRLEDLFNHIDD